MKTHETGLARNSDPETSHEAAWSVDTTSLQDLVLHTLRYGGGMTAAELSGELRKPLNTISPRTRQLVNRGLIKDSGERRPTPSGRKAIVWRATTPAERKRLI